MQEWCKNNVIQQNQKLMLLTTRQKRLHITTADMTLTYNDETLNNISDDKILGVQVDDHVLFSNHIDKIARKIDARVKHLAAFKNKRLFK